MNKTSARPPILSFLLAFIGLLAAALCLAALSPAPEPVSDNASAFGERRTEPDATGAGRADRSATGHVR